MYNYILYTMQVSLVSFKCIKMYEYYHYSSNPTLVVFIIKIALFPVLGTIILKWNKHWANVG